MVFDMMTIEDFREEDFDKILKILKRSLNTV